MAVRFTGSQYYARTFPSAINTYSVCGWFKVSQDRNDVSTFWDLNNSGSFNYEALSTDPTGVGLVIYASGHSSLPMSDLTVGTWYYIGVSVGSNAVVRVRQLNGASFSTYSQSGHTGIDAVRLLIGESLFGNERLNGAIAYFKLWSAALTAAELEAEYESPTPVRTSNLYAYYRFDTASTTDNSGNGRTLTATGTPTTEPSPEVPGLIQPFSGWGIPIL